MADRLTLQIEPIDWKFGLPTKVHASFFINVFRGGPCWDIDAIPLIKTSNCIRKELNALAEKYDAVQSSSLYQPADLILQKLATLGKRLYLIIFGSSDAQAFLNRLNNDEESKFDIIVQESPKLDYIKVPWGLIFDPRVKSSSPAWTVEEYHDNFWCVRHNLATVYQNVDAWRCYIKKSESGLVSVLCKEVLYEIGECVNTWPTNNLYYDWDSFCFSNHENQNRVLHFFCHGIEDNLYFEEGVAIGPDEFRLYVNQRPNDVMEVSIFNACESTFAARGEWLKAVWDKGLRGFIGTEAKVPSKFAWNFGRDLIKGLLSNRTPTMAISYVMNELRKKYRPFGLLYALNADPDVYFPNRICTDYIPEIGHKSQFRRSG